MEHMIEGLRRILRNAQKVIILGIGSELRADDGAGVLVIKKLKASDLAKNSSVKIMDGGTAPENLTGEIKQYQPSHVIIIDAAEMEQEPGTAVLMDPEESTGISFSTHTLPIKVMVDYLREFIQPEFVIIGIQPESIQPNECPSDRVKIAIERVSAILINLLSEVAKVG